MKYIFLPFTLLILAVSAFGQASKIYITSDNKYSYDAVNAVSYILVSKTPDSLYFVRQFNMKDSIELEATYVDNQLSVQHGEYKLYRWEKQVRTTKFDYNTKKLDTLIVQGKNYLSTKGYYINGIKEGEWIDYYRDGCRQKLNTFHAGKLNGSFKMYGPGNTISIEGGYLNDKLNGIWYNFSFKGDTSGIDYYSDGVLKKHISYLSDKKFKSHFKLGMPSYDLSYYINKKISKEDRDTIYKNYYGKYTFTLTKEGKLTNAIIERVNNLKVDTDIIEIFLAGSLWKPATIDNNAAESLVEIDVAPLRQNGKIVSIIAQISGKVIGYNGY